MRRKRYFPKPRPDLPEAPFESAEHAWFWCLRALALRRAGARLTGGGGFARPCEPDDIALAVKGLYRRRRLDAVQVKALAVFGGRSAPPDLRVVEEGWALKPWAAAIDQLAQVLKAKGIVE